MRAAVICEPLRTPVGGFGAALCIVTSPEKAAELGLRPLARLVSWAVAGGAEDHGHRPGAVDRQGAGTGRADPLRQDLIELNEAFAAQVLACTREWKLEPATDERFNVTARASRSGTRSAPPEPGSWPPCCASWTAARGGTGWRRCASAAVRA